MPVFFLFLFSVDQLIYVSQLCYNGDFEKELSLSSSIIFSKWLPSWKKELLKGLGSYIRILSLVICQLKKRLNIENTIADRKLVLYE